MAINTPSPPTKMMAGLAVIVPGRPDRILIGLRSASLANGNTWTIPGGSVDEQEGIEIAAVREFYEETGFTPETFPIDYDTLRPATVTKNDEGFFTTIVCQAKKEVEPPHVGKHEWETQGFKWADLDSLEDMPDLHPQFRQALPAIRNTFSTKHLFKPDKNGQTWLVGSHFTPTDFTGRPKIFYHDEATAAEKDKLIGTVYGVGLYIAPELARESYLHNYGKSVEYREYSGSYEWKLRVRLNPDTTGILDWGRPVPAELRENLLKNPEIAANGTISAFIKENGQEATNQPLIGQRLYSSLRNTFGDRKTNDMLLKSGCNGIMDGFCYVCFDPDNDIDWDYTHRLTLKEPTPMGEVLRREQGIHKSKFDFAEKIYKQVSLLEKELSEEDQRTWQTYKDSKAFVSSYDEREKEIEGAIEKKEKERSKIGIIDPTLHEIIFHVLKRDPGFFAESGPDADPLSPFSDNFLGNLYETSLEGNPLDSLAEYAHENGVLAALEKMSKSPDFFGKIRDERSTLDKIPVIGKANPHKVKIQSITGQMAKTVKERYATYSQKIIKSRLYDPHQTVEQVLTNIITKYGTERINQTELLDCDAFTQYRKERADLYDRRDKLSEQRAQAIRYVENVSSSRGEEKRRVRILAKAYDHYMETKSAYEACSSPTGVRRLLNIIADSTKRHKTTELKAEIEETASQFYSESAFEKKAQSTTTNLAAPEDKEPFDFSHAMGQYGTLLQAKDHPNLVSSNRCAFALYCSPKLRSSLEAWAEKQGIQNSPILTHGNRVIVTDIGNDRVLRISNDQEKQGGDLGGEVVRPVVQDTIVAASVPDDPGGHIRVEIMDRVIPYYDVKDRLGEETTNFIFAEGKETLAKSLLKKGYTFIEDSYSTTDPAFNNLCLTKTGEVRILSTNCLKSQKIPTPQITTPRQSKHRHSVLKSAAPRLHNPNTAQNKYNSTSVPKM